MFALCVIEASSDAENGFAGLKFQLFADAWTTNKKKKNGERQMVENSILTINRIHSTDSSIFSCEWFGAASVSQSFSVHDVQSTRLFFLVFFLYIFFLCRALTSMNFAPGKCDAICTVKNFAGKKSLTWPPPRFDCSCFIPRKGRVPLVSEVVAHDRRTRMGKSYSVADWCHSMQKRTRRIPIGTFAKMRNAKRAQRKRRKETKQNTHQTDSHRKKITNASAWDSESHAAAATIS